MNLLQQYSEIWVLDFEFYAPPGERPHPLCLVAREYFTGVTHRMWEDEITTRTNPPFLVGEDSLIVAYFASAEMGCFLAAGWQFPVNLLDLYTEFRKETNGLDPKYGAGLVGALQYHGLPAIEVAEKEAMRDLAMRGGTYTTQERQQLLKYCESDVTSLEKLLVVMHPKIDLPRALLRGRFMCAVAKIEWSGVPIDKRRLHRLRTNWLKIQSQLVASVDIDYGVYEGTTFKQNLFAKWLDRKKITWPRLITGKLALDSNTFQKMAKRHPEVSALRELRHSLGEMRLEKLSVGSDHRNRCLLSPFRSRTSRNQPSNNKFIFGPSCWLRGLIKPPPGRAIAYVDWSQQEFAICAALSGDKAMQQAYLTADPYLTFAKQAKAVPESATKQSHPSEREQFKVCALGVQYGMQSQSLAQTLGLPESKARELLKLHKQTYPDFWKWSQAAVDHSMLFNWNQTVFGWRIHVKGHANPRSLANFPSQANGAEMLRLACCFATERDIMVCAPIHDALLVEGDLESINEVVKATQQAMLDAGRVVLNGFALRTDVEIVRSPDRYMDPRGEKMWNTTMSILNELESIP